MKTAEELCIKAKVPQGLISLFVELMESYASERERETAIAFSEYRKNAERMVLVVYKTPEQYYNEWKAKQ